MPHRLLDLRIMYVWRYQWSVFISLHDSCLLFVNIVELIYSTLSLPHKKLVFFLLSHCNILRKHNTQCKKQNERNACQTTHLLSLLILWSPCRKTTHPLATHGPRSLEGPLLRITGLMARILTPMSSASFGLHTYALLFVFGSRGYEKISCKIYG